MSQRAEHLLKAELVDAVRMLERAEYMNHSGHASIRRDETTFYVNSGASVRASLTVEDVVVVDLDGRLVEPGGANPPLEFPLHAEVYRARPDVGAVIHTHPQWSTYLTVAGVAPQIVYGQAAVLGDVGLFDSPESVTTRDRGQAVLAAMGEGQVVLLKAHGAVCAAPDMLECFAYAAYVEENARRQYMAMQIGTPYAFTADERAGYRRRLHSASLFRKTWDYYRSAIEERPPCRHD